MVTHMTIESIDQIPDFPTSMHVPLLKLMLINNRGYICLAGWTRLPVGSEVTLISEVTITGNEARGWFKPTTVKTSGATLSMIELVSPARSKERPEECTLILSEVYEQIIVKALGEEGTVSCSTILTEEPLTCWEVYTAGHWVSMIALPREEVTSSLVSYFSQLQRKGMAKLQESLLGQAKSRTLSALGLPKK
ncbi:MAG TPA: hypothetical protein VGE59_01565 [Patescibacteria group bacterium]